jgi:hypothetical protein
MRSALLALVVVIAALPLIYLYATTPPATVEVRDGDATIFFQASHSRILFPGQCVQLNWEVGGIRTVHVNGEGQIGSGSEQLCNPSVTPSIRVVLRDDRVLTYPLAIEKLYFNPAFAGLWLVVVSALAGIGFLWLGVPGALTILIPGIFGPKMYALASFGADFGAHAGFAQRMAESGLSSNPAPHFLYHILEIMVVAVIPGLTFKTAGFLIVLAADIATAILIYQLLRRTNEEAALPGGRKALLYILLAVSLFLVFPVVFSRALVTADARAYSALIYASSPHSPTYLLLRPFAVAIVWLCAQQLMAMPSRWQVSAVSLAVLTALSLFAKPSFVIAFLPALGIVLAYRFVRGTREGGWLIVGSVFIPATLVLGWQYWYTYSPQAQAAYSTFGGEPARIVFAPLELFLGWWHMSAADIIPQMLLSAAFPAVVYLAYFPQARRNLTLNLAWLTFLIGYSYGLLLVETPNTPSANMLWSGKIGLFVLFVITLAFFVRQNKGVLLDGEKIRFDPRFLVCGAVYMLHLLPNLLAFT